jgi:hypothetical protein
MANSPTIYDPLNIPPGKKLIFRPWYDHPVTGKRIFAAQYGKKVFPMIVDDVD